jgi:MFS family permease
LIGTWMQSVAMSWLVWRLTQSSLLLGLVGFSSQVPAFILAPFAGVLIDRWNRRRVLLVTQTLAMLQAFALAALTLTGTVTVWLIVVLSVFIGFVNAFDMPTRQAFVVEMVENREDLPNAIALNSSMFNGARLVGPSIAGVLIALVGEGLCFFFNGVSFLAVIVALLAMRVVPHKARAAQQAMLEGLKEGFDHAFGFAPIRSILLLIAIVGLMGMPFTVLMPVFATEVLHGGADTLGFLTASVGVGALSGAIYLASRRSVLGLGRIAVAAAATFGLGLVAFSQSRMLWLSMLLLFVAGFGMIVQMASSNTIIQTIVDEDKRGRIMSFYTMSFMGTAPFGSLIAGGLADRFGAPFAVMVGGAVCVAGAIVFAFQLPAMSRMVRPIYSRMGIIPEIAAGVGSATELTEPPEEP